MSLARLRVENRTIVLLFFLFSTNAFPIAEDTEDADTSTAETRSAFAALSELGKNLRDFVLKTKGQISNILKKLNISDKSFNQLSLLTSEIKEEEEELKKTTVVLQANNEEVKSLSLGINSKVEDIMRERIQLWNQVGGLEEKLSGLSQGFLSADQFTEISALKEVILTQERSISDFLQAVKEQTEELDGQKNKIKSLEKKLNPARLQETLPKYSWDGELSSVSGYLSSFSSDGSFSSDFQRDCGEIFSSGEKSSGLYPVKPNGSEAFLVYCEFTEEATFTVLQRRRGGTVDFNQPWKSYEDGFGDFRSEFWLGLRKIFSITRPSGSLLHIHIENWNQEKHVMEFQYMLEGPDSNYTIHLNTGADVPTIMRFSTEEHNDGNRPKAPHCADDHTGGWWFSTLGDINLNGKCIQIQFGKKGVHGKWDNGGQSRLKYTQISIRHR